MFTSLLLVCVIRVLLAKLTRKLCLKTNVYIKFNIQVICLYLWTFLCFCNYIRMSKSIVCVFMDVLMLMQMNEVEFEQNWTMCLEWAPWSYIVNTVSHYTSVKYLVSLFDSKLSLFSDVVCWYWLTTLSYHT